MVQLSVREAANQLSVSPRRVRAMLQDGILRGDQIGGRWLVDASSLNAAGKPSGRPFSERVAWALIDLADGRVPAGALAAGALSVEGPLAGASRLEGRGALPPRCDGPSGGVLALVGTRSCRACSRTSDSLHQGKSDPRSGISAGDYAEGYVEDRDFDDLVADHLLVPARGPENVVLRQVHRSISAPLPWLAVAADLADGDAREAQQAALLLDKHRSRA